MDWKRFCRQSGMGVELRGVGTMGTIEHVDAIALQIEAERAECEWILNSGALGRSGNLARVLRYICDEYFEGRADQIKEYTIAVEALGRRAAFDPQTDTIVRVIVHALRKRLLEIYQTEGANHPVRLIIPAGHYGPSFVHQHLKISNGVSAVREIPSDCPPLGGDETLDPLEAAAEDAPLRRSWHRSFWYVAGILCAVGAVAWFGAREVKKWRSARVAVVANLPLPAPQDFIRALMGTGREPYVDHSGNTWSMGNYCQGGTNVAVGAQRIEGTEDPALYLGGVRGIAHCIFPVTHSLNELRFHFAETSDLPIATRLASLSINAGPPVSVDVVDDAGGHNIATSTIATGIAPENDGSIHLDFVSEVSLLNAVEILPAASVKQLPVRIVASSKSFVDEANQVWTSDRYFSGGRHGLPPRGANVSSLGIYQSVRIGRFRYNIPAVPHVRYRVNLYFREPWFGKENGGNGGPGSRIFDVACNGVLLIKNFDILAEGDSKPIVKTFENVQASAAGRIELYFMPVVNYPVVNAIEILPED